ncbi:hypothetical protein GW17_00014298, partial [Ensete ventricosum]
PPLPALRCKRGCSRATTAPTGCYPWERCRPPLRAATPASGVGLPCGLVLAAPGHPLVGCLGRGLDMGGRPCMGVGRLSSSLPSL